MPNTAHPSREKTPDLQRRRLRLTEKALAAPTKAPGAAPTQTPYGG